MSTIQKAISEELKRVLRRDGLTVSAAGKLLGISRQSMHAYLNGTSVPRSAVLAKAVSLWHLNIVVGDFSFGTEAFPAVSAVNASPEQLNFQNAFEKIRPEDLKLQIKKVGNELRISVELVAA